MSYHTSQENVRALIQVQKYTKFTKAELKACMAKYKNSKETEDILYMIDRDIFVDTHNHEKAQYIVKANGIYHVTEDKMSPYVKGERFIYIRSGRMFE